MEAYPLILKCQIKGCVKSRRRGDILVAHLYGANSFESRVSNCISFGWIKSFSRHGLFLQHAQLHQFFQVAGGGLSLLTRQRHVLKREAIFTTSKE